MRINRTICSSYWIEPTTWMSVGVALLICRVSIAANLNPEEAVREFLRNPPVITEAKLVIRREGVPAEWYICKRQPDAAFVRWCVDSNEFYNAVSPAQNRVVAFYENNHWSFHRGSLTEWYDRGRTDETNNVVKRAFGSYSTALQLLMSLGISWLPLASLTISNGVFSFSSPDGVVSGNLQFEDGKLIAAETQYPIAPTRASGVIRRTEYIYATAFPDFPFLPNAWVLYARRPGKDANWIKLEECTIVSIEGQNVPQSSKAYSPEAAGIIAADRLFWVQGTNVVYYDPLTATNRIVRSLNDPLAVKRHKKPGRVIYGILAILLVLPLGVIAWRSLASNYKKT